MYFAFVKQKAVQGDQTTNPFYFENMNLKKFVLEKSEQFLVDIIPWIEMRNGIGQKKHMTASLMQSLKKISKTRF